MDDDVLLGELSIEVALRPAGQAWVDVQFTYDINGILHVAVENEMGGAQTDSPGQSDLK